MEQWGQQRPPSWPRWQLVLQYQLNTCLCVQALVGTRSSLLLHIQLPVDQAQEQHAPQLLGRQSLGADMPVSLVALPGE